jgi:hypothetical protein
MAKRRMRPSKKMPGGRKSAGAPPAYQGKGEELKLRVSAAEKSVMRKAAREAAERVGSPDLLSRRPRHKDRFLSEWARRVLLAAAGDRGGTKPADSPGAWEDRDAAWEAFKALTKAGWRSEDAGGGRDELHDR